MVPILNPVPHFVNQACNLLWSWLLIFQLLEIKIVVVDDYSFHGSTMYCDGGACVYVHESKTCPNDFSPAPGDPGVHRAVQAPGRETKFNIQVPNKVQVRTLRGVGERGGKGLSEISSTCLDPSPHILTSSPGSRRWERNK